MRKLVSVLLAVASIVCTTSSLAATSTGTLEKVSRNGKTEMVTDQADVTGMPTFRGGDLIKFDVSSLTDAEFLTVISYKYDKPDDLSNATIQYIDQYTVNGDTQTIDYVLRDNTDDGVYKLSFSGDEVDDGSGIVDFYYKVGNPVVAMIRNVEEDLNYWNIEPHTIDGKTYYAVGYVAKAVIGSDVSLDELGVASLGFSFSVNGVDTQEHFLTEQQFKAMEAVKMNSESSGKVAFVYGVTIYGIDTVDHANAIKAEAIFQDK